MSEPDTPDQKTSDEKAVDAEQLDADVTATPEGDADVGPERAQPMAAAGEAPPRPGKALYLGVILALVFAFFAAGTSGSLWWQYRQFYVSLDQADADAVASVQGLRATLRALEDRLELLQESDERVLELTGELERRFDAMPGRIVDLEQRLTAVQGVSPDARRRWLRAEAEYFLTVANAELSLGGRWENAVSGLEFADGKLRELADPSLGGVRARISQELQELRRVNLPDVEGLSYSLSRLTDRVDELPMGPTVPGSFDSAGEPPENVEPGLGRVWLSLKEAVAGMISVQRSDVPSSRSLTGEEQLLVRRQLALELEMARLGLLRSQAEVFAVGLNAARTLLRRDFDGSDPAVESAVALIEDMLRLDIDPARPDISGSLNLLRGLPDRAD